MCRPHGGRLAKSSCVIPTEIAVKLGIGRASVYRKQRVTGELAHIVDQHARTATRSVPNPNKLDKLGFGCINYTWNSHHCPLSGHQRS